MAEYRINKDGFEEVVFHDDFENTAIIEEVYIPTYVGSIPRTCFRLKVTADYNKDFLYYVSVYDSLQEAEFELKKISQGTFK